VNNEGTQILWASAYRPCTAGEELKLVLNVKMRRVDRVRGLFDQIALRRTDIALGGDKKIVTEITRSVKQLPGLPVLLRVLPRTYHQHFSPPEMGSGPSTGVSGFDTRHCPPNRFRRKFAARGVESASAPSGAGRVTDSSLISGTVVTIQTPR
jgi:hypothetical protein